MRETEGHDGSTEVMDPDRDEAGARYEPPAIAKRTSIDDLPINPLAVSCSILPPCGPTWRHLSGGAPGLP